MALKEDRTGLEKKFYDLCEKLVPEAGLELYDLEYLPGSYELRVYIRNPQTKTAVIEDCIAVDRALTPFLEEEWVPEKLTLEVSSPGLFRVLRTSAHFAEVAGENVCLTLRERIDAAQYPGLPKSVEKNKKFVALMTGVHETGIEILIDEMKVKIPFENIKKANLETSLNHKEH